MTAYHWTPVIATHATTALTTLVLGGLVLYRTKGTAAHRLWGRLWVGLMLVIVLTSLFIYRGHYSWIHALSFFTLAMLPYGVYLARTRNTKKHGFTMVGLYLGALVIAGVFTLLPNRLMGSALWQWLGQ